AEIIISQIIDKIEELNTLINDAQIVKESVRASEDGKDTPDYQEWVTNEAKNTLGAAIDSAEAIANKTNINLDELEVAKNQLEAAIEDFSDAIEDGKKVTVTTFDKLYLEGKIALEGGKVYGGVESFVGGVNNIYLDANKIYQIFGDLKPGESLKMSLDGQFLKQSDGTQSFIKYESSGFYMLSDVQQSYNNWTTITPATIGQLSGSTETHAATIHLVRAHGDELTVVENLIDALPNPEDINESYKEAVVAARTAYEALDTELRLMVYNYTKLVEIEAQLPKNITSMDYYIVGVATNENGRLYDIKETGPLSIDLGEETTKENLKLRLPREVQVSLDTYETIKLIINWQLTDYDGSSGTYNFIGSLILPNGIVNPEDEFRASITVNIEDVEIDNTYTDLWNDFENIINTQAKQAEPYDRVLIEYDEANMFVNIKINDDYHNKGASEIVFGTGLRTAVMSLLQSEDVVSLRSEGIEFNTLDEDGNKRTEDELQDDAMNVALSWVPKLSAKLNTYLIYREIEFTLYGKDGQSATYYLYFY
ncbi:MAG: hypothetical protein GX815_05665, partial [Clostridiales bacterium]|nr:hypothetical protein [Clostridiales bacterium]